MLKFQKIKTPFFKNLSFRRPDFCASYATGPEPATSSAPLNSTTEFELDDYFTDMATVYLPPTNNEPTTSETQPITTVTQPTKRGHKPGSTNKKGTKKSRALTQLNIDN